MATLILDIMYNVETQDDFSDNFYMTMSLLGCNCKLLNFMIYRDEIMILINTLREEPFLPKNPAEVDIKMKFDKIIESNAVQFLTVVQCILMVSWVSTPIMESKSRKLVFRSWIPYNYSSPTLYGVTYMHQMISTTADTVMHIAVDTLFNGFLLCIYCQLEILEYRLQHLAKHEQNSAKECARHHNRIYKYAATVNKSFQVVLCFQFIAAGSMICFNIYRLTQTKITEKGIETIMLMFCSLLQIFYYCWYGNEVKQKSLKIPDAILASNWESLDINSKRTLLMVMLRATFPMEFTSAHVVSVNLESFMTVIKTSYSAYNVLNR
ncbi:odorant receptor 10-like isoform X2 [Nomia melanderi]